MKSKVASLIVLPLCLVLVATAIRVALDPLVGVGIPYAFYFLSIAIAAQVLGFWPAAITTVMSGATVRLFFVEPRFSFSLPRPEDVTGLLVFTGIGLCIALLGRYLHQARADAERSANEARELLALLDLAPVLIRDVEDRITHWNKGCARLYGYSEEEALSRTSHDLLQTRFPEPLAQIRSTLFRQGHWEGELLHKRSSGETVIVASEWVLWRNGLGKPRAILETNRDVTDIRRANESAARLAAIVESSDDAIISKDLNTRILSWNAGAERLYGYRAEEVLGKSIEILLPDDRRDEEGRILAILRAGSRVEHIETARLNKAGNLIAVSITTSPIRDSNGAIIGTSNITRDISERKQTEKLLQESEERLQLAQQVAKIGTFELNLQTEENFWTPAMEEMYGLTPGTFEGTQKAWLDLIHPDDRPEVRDLMTAAVETGRLEGDWRVLWPDGSIHWLAARGHVFKNERGIPQKLIGVNIDITERKLTEQELKAARISAEQAKAAADRANTAKDQFLAVLSHELRTPLTPALAAVSLMERGGSLSQRQGLEIIRRNIELEARLIDDLLDLTRIARGKISLEKRTMEIQEVLNRTAETCRPDLEARGLHFHVGTLGGPHYVHGDISRLQQVFWNLLKNSIKFTPAGGCIGMLATTKETDVVVEITDSGIGIEREAMDRIFNAFEQADKRITRQFGGLGLGLAITKRLVELHDGTISVHSDGKGQGTTFRVALPLSAPAPDGNTNISDKKKSYLRPLNILLVEDHHDTAEMLQELLRSRGHHVQAAADVTNAIRAASAENFDLLISDLGLPDRSGLDLMQELREQGKTFKGIALSGFGREEDIERSRSAGFLEHLTKPVDIDILMRTVERLIDR